MMGGGTSLREAIRPGANVIGYDLDPKLHEQRSDEWRWRRKYEPAPLATYRAQCQCMVDESPLAILP
jgi:hypothetical protein